MSEKSAIRILNDSIGFIVPVLFVVIFSNAALAQSFDCRRAQSDEELAICANNELGRLDVQMSALYVATRNRLAVAPRQLQSIVTRQRSWLVQRNRCGPDVRCLDRLYRLRIAELGGSAANVQPLKRKETAVFANCADEETAFKTLAAQMKVEVFLPRLLQVGERITVRWSLPNRFPLKHAVYLIFSMPEEVRFEGAPLMALPGGARAPLSISFGKKKMRAFVPLYMPGTPSKGSFDIKPYRSGEFGLQSAIVAKTKCGERILDKHWKWKFDVSPGQPQIVVQDIISTPDGQRGKLKQVIISNNNRYRMHVYDKRYEVYDRVTGAKLVDRAGYEPNFSPSSRFVAARITESQGAESGHTETIDLLAGRIIPALSAGDTLAWAHSDSMLIRASYSSSSGNWLYILPTLIDLRRKKETLNIETENISWNLSTESQTHKTSMLWDDVQFLIDIDNGVFVLKDEGVSQEKTSRPFEVQEISSGYNTSCREVRECKGTSCWSVTVCWNANETLNQLNHSYAVSSIRLPQHWDIETGLKFSHVRNVVTQDAWDSKRHTPLDYVLKHQIFKPDNWQIKLASTKSISAIRGGWRALTRIKAPKSGRLGITKNLNDLNVSIAGNLAKISLSREVKVEEFITKNSYTPSLQNILQHMASTVPISKAYFPRNDGHVSIKVPLSEFIAVGGVKEPDVLEWILDDRYHANTKGLWHWRIGPKNYWLIQMHSIEGTGQFGHGGLFFIRSDIRPYGELSNLTNIYGKEKMDNYDYTEQGNRIKAEISMGRYLLLGRVVNKAIAVVDLKKRQRIALFNEIEHANLMQGLYLTRDARHLLQTNSDGRFFLYSIAQGKRVLSGRYIDDEIIIYDKNGYYDASYEGAHFVNLQFPGEAGLHSFQQFTASLHRPDVIRAILQGYAPPKTPPQLAVPPKVKFSLRQVGEELTATISAQSGSGLKKLRLYQDGQLAREIPLDGKHASKMFTMLRRGNARWITAQVEDVKSYLSRPVSYLLPANTSKGGRLRMLAVGVDHYKDARLPSLRYAGSDARTLTEAVSANKGGYYQNIELKTLIDQQATTDAIRSRLSAMVDDAVPGDTIVLSYASHGVKGANGSFYLTTSTTRMDDLPATALPWTEVAAILSRSKARVVVFLDACHAGLAGRHSFASNDDVAGKLIRGAKAPILILAASKGRQFSQEQSALAGGVFSRGVEDVLLKNRTHHDRNRNGVIEISELYAGVKSFVTTATNGKQTPWLARHDLIGDFTLF